MKLKSLVPLCIGAALICSASATAFAANTDNTTAIDYQAIISQAYNNYKADNSGAVANYIPALAKYNAKLYGIAIATADGKIYSIGDVNKPFPLESLTKVFSLSLALNQYGSNEVLKKLGANPTGMPFNSAIAIELHPDQPQNPLVNAGAMSTVSLLKAKNANDKWNLILSNMESYADASLNVNNDVYKSESETNQHNQALAKLMLSYNHFYSPTEEAVDLYTKQCSVEATAIQLAKMGAVIANNGTSPFNHKQLLDKKNVPNLLAEMSIAGLYDGAGTWFYETGIPAKSGVGGGVFAVVPGKYAIAVYSPPLDAAGNSVRAQEAIKYVLDKTNANLFKHS